jgi:hypothetical protein
VLYRIVLHTHFAPGSDPAAVKREFARVTGLTREVTEQLFAGSSTVLKRQVTRADAERIAATLRAVGVHTTVELEGGAPDAVPLGDPTVAPAMATPDPAATKPSSAKRFAGRLRTYTNVALMTGVLALLVWALVPVYERMRPPVTTATPAKSAGQAPVRAPAAEEEAAAPAALKASNLEGPWRCTDQRTGLVQYWLYRKDGSLVYNGEKDFTKGEMPPAGPDVPTGWELVGNKVRWLYPGKPPEAARANTVRELTLTRFDFDDSKGESVACRRP